MSSMSRISSVSSSEEEESSGFGRPNSSLKGSRSIKLIVVSGSEERGAFIWFVG